MQSRRLWCALTAQMCTVLCIACLMCSLRAQLPHIKPFPGKRSVVILDNAKIHHTHEFVRLVNEAGGMVLYTPPYCFDCTPLDNGAFGRVKQYLEKHSEIFNQVSLEEALDKAFDEAVSRRSARKFFRLCNYL